MSKQGTDPDGSLVVLGGSSPFTARLIDCLAETVVARRLVLQGRSERDLEILSRYAVNRLTRLGWVVDSETRPERALERASVVVHQNRYGGTSGRDEDERFALRFGVAPDETLGPAALRSVLRSAHSIREIACFLARVCPQAWVLNLTNPLSVTTSLLAEGGVGRCIGLCELPLVTARAAAAACGAIFSDLAWGYAGFNHRGFVVELSWRGRNLIAELAAGTHALAGVDARTVAELRSIPTKYFKLVQRQTGVHAGRAQQVATIRRRALDDLRSDATRSPPSLGERYMAWYPESVVPLISALDTDLKTRHVVNVSGDDGLTRERHAEVSRAGITLPPLPDLPPAAQRWVDRFERHERAALDVARDPGPGSIRNALDLDPMLKSLDVSAMARELALAGRPREAR